MGLKEYQAKRDFARTREPSGAAARPHAGKALRFVIQKHAASHLHYDFRLEMEGVLKSWAVPKGLPTHRGERRLAMEVEDHPLDYGRFEGTIPPGNYGAGTVMVWDIGTYESSGDPLEGLRRGKLHFTLHGKKLTGEWTLVRMRPRGTREKPQWLMLKSGTDLPAISAGADDQSALTRRTMEQIAGARRKREWQSNRASTSPAPAERSRRTERRAPPPASARARSTAAAQPEEPPPNPAAVAEIELKHLRRAKAEFVEPMKALLVSDLPRGSQWVYEIKFDGVRALAIKNRRSVSLISRTNNDLTTKYPEVVEALRELPAKEAVLDGEVVAVDPEGRSSFQLLQSYANAGSKKPPLFYYAFDLIQLDGHDLKGLPLWQRKAMAQALVGPAGPRVRFSASIAADSARVMREMQARGLEGLIAKQKDSKYEAGQRTGAWAKFKWTTEQEFVIGGFTEPQGARTHFGALLVGYYEKGRLMFAAKVGTGFNHKLLSALHTRLKKLRQADCPFVNLPENLPGRAKGLTASKMRFCHWVQPKLVCQIRFAEWTRDNHLRQPAFLGLREDKVAKEVVRERPKS